MLGSMIAKIRKEKHITKVELSKRTGINIGHITHIEKGERNPSHKTLNIICKALEVPYQTLTYLYDKHITEEHKRYEILDHLAYNKIPLVNSFSDFIECPDNISNASIAIKVSDDTMEPCLKKNSYCFVELNVPLNNKDIGLFKYDNKFIIRKFIVRKDKLVLRADNKNYDDISLSEKDNFTIIGRILK